MMSDSVEKTCGSCKYWLHRKNRDDFKTVVRFCGPEGWRVKVRKENEIDKLFGRCEKIVMGTDLSMDDEIPLAVTLDSSEYQADLFTQEEFGCILWESKEGNDDRNTEATSEGSG